MRKSHGQLPEGDHGVHESERGKRHILRRRTLQEIAAALSTKGLREAVERYESYLTPPTTNYAIVDDQSRRRTTLRRQGGGDLDYVWHGPPSWFDPRYVILEVTVGERGNVEFMTHAGEELLYVMPEREITYEFFWPNRKPPWLGTIPNTGVRVSEWDKKVMVPPGYLIRINSTLLHRNTTAHPSGATSPATAKAWIILQSPAGPAALLVHPHAEDSPVGSFRKSTERRRKFEEGGIFLRAFKKEILDAMDPGNFLLLASGVSEKLTLHRKRAELPIEKLAAQCELNKSYVSRLERRELNNVSIPTLLDLAAPIDADISELVTSTDWAAVWERDTTSQERRYVAGPPPPDERFGRKKRRTHHLHPVIIALKPGGPSEQFKASSNYDDMTSVIVLGGEVIFRFEDDHKQERKLLVANQVFHARHNLAFETQALTDSKLLVIRYSGQCSCQTRIGSDDLPEEGGQVTKTE